MKKKKKKTQGRVSVITCQSFARLQITQHPNLLLTCTAPPPLHKYSKLHQQFLKNHQRHPKKSFPHFRFPNFALLYQEKKTQLWVRLYWLSWPRVSAFWPGRFLSSKWWIRTRWWVRVGPPDALDVTGQEGSPACAPVGRTTIMGAGLVPGRVAWPAAVAVEPERAGLFRFRYRFALRTSRREDIRVCFSTNWSNVM